jgi:hypothetical protein
LLSFLLSNTGKLQQDINKKVEDVIQQDRLQLIQQQTLLLQQIANLLERQQELEQELKAVYSQNNNIVRKDAKKDIPQQTKYYRSQTQTVSPSSEKNEIVRKMSFIAHDASLKAQERNSRLSEEQKRREEEKKEDSVEKEEEKQQQKQKEQQNLQEEKT